MLQFFTVNYSKWTPAGRVNLGHQVAAYVGGDMDTPIETIYHPACFRTKYAAERFAEKVAKACYQKNRPLNFAHWIIAEANDLVSGYRRNPGEEQPALYSPLNQGKLQPEIAWD